MWESIAIFITWDEWGGLYDLPAPPTVDDVELGFRVPMMVISPYANAPATSTTRSRSSPPLRFIADNWDLPYLTPRIANSHNYKHVFDFDRRPRPPSPGRHVRATNDFWDWPDVFGVAAVARPRGPEDPLPLIGRGCRALAAVVGQLVLQARQGVEHLRGEHGDEGRLVSHPGWQRILLPCSSPFVTVSRNAEISSRVVPFCSISARSMKMWVGCVNSTMRTSSPSVSKCSWIGARDVAGLDRRRAAHCGVGGVARSAVSIITHSPSPTCSFNRSIRSGSSASCACTESRISTAFIE